MTKYWKKLGQIYTLKESGRHPKLISHASNPLPVQLEGDIYRIFFSGRDESNRSSVGAVDIDLINRKVVNEHYFPFFEFGPEGSFFADGVSIGNCYEVNGVRYMLFMGWQNAIKGRHWRGDIGRLIVTPEATLKLDSSMPFMGCDSIDPISLSYPWVHMTSSGEFDMWYGSTLAWDAGNGEMLHVIQHAHSDDGHHWRRSGLSVPYEIGYAQAFSRPTVVKAGGIYEMWFSYRSGSGEKYRIGYATSEDGLIWDLKLDGAGISVSSDGWDSEMIEYPFVLDHSGRRYMFYNGNQYGKTGFGLAVLDEC
jgi:hypothetical protein